MHRIHSRQFLRIPSRRAHNLSASLRHACARFMLLAVLVSGVVCILKAQQSARSADSTLLQQVRQAARLAEQGNAQAAMDIAQKLLAEHPHFAQAIKLKAMLLEQAGRETESNVLDEEALRLAPNDADLLLKVGVLKLRAQQYEEAIRLLERCARVLPQDGDAQFYLAQAYHLNGQDDLALGAMRRSVKAEPGNASILQKYGELLCSQKDFTQGLQWLQKAAAIDLRLPRMDYDIAWADYNLMDLAPAAEFAARAVRARPSDTNALQLLAMAQLKLQLWQEAKDSFERMLALGAGSAELLQNLGQCELELKNYAVATQRLEAALRMDPTLILAHFYLSRTYAMLGRTADAQQEAALHRLMMERMTFVRAAAAEQRENAITPQTRELLKEHREEEALRLYAEHFKGTSATPANAHVFIGKVYLFMGETEDGVRSLQYALKMQPTVRDAHTNQGILALKDGELDRAEREFKAELANDPNSQTAIAELGEVRYHQQRWAESAEQISMSRTMTPELLYMLCDADFHLGRIQDANLTAQLTAIYGRNNKPLMQELIGLLKVNGQDETAQRLVANLDTAASTASAP
ncbi:MAG: tetratricopeptide repeat protein [Terracidiphilus sp.]|nr:tetratricopeptide repeat protein [Terracidiphilus sp.]